MPVARASTRVSTDEQAESGLGLAAQEKACRACAERLGLELASVHADEGVCSVTPVDKRPGLMAALAELKKGDVLIVAKRDRLGRDPIIMATIEALLKRKGARVVSAGGEGTEGDGPTDILMRRMIDAFAEFERALIRSRTKAALAIKKERGERYSTRLPYGTELAGDGKTLLPCAAELEVIALIRDLRAGGMTLEGIAAELNSRGIRRRGGSPWVYQFVARLLKTAA